MFDLQAYLTDRREEIDRALDRALDRGTEDSRIVAAMRHSLMGGGKRLRPVLCMAAAGAVGGNASGKTARAAACALEMIHTYSLIHDDLPAMDDDDLRRGKPTCHRAFDEATAVLAGDALLTLAFESLAAAAMDGSGISPDRWLRVIREIAAAAGHHGMIEGQMRDIAAETTPLDREALEAMHSLKTGALIRASVRAGAMLGGGTETEIDALDRYAAQIGLAFQVTDDILNVEGDPAVMGKAAGTDASRNKSTYPGLMGLTASRSFARKLVENALQALDAFNAASDPLRAIARYILDRKR